MVPDSLNESSDFEQCPFVKCNVISVPLDGRILYVIRIDVTITVCMILRRK